MLTRQREAPEQPPPATAARRPLRRWLPAAAAGAGLLLVAIVVQLRTPAEGEQLAEPVRFRSGELVGVEPLRRRVMPGETVPVRLHFRGAIPSREQLELRLTPIGFDAYVEPAPEPARISLGGERYAVAEVPVAVPPFFRPGAYTFRVVGREPTFGHVEIVRGARR